MSDLRPEEYIGEEVIVTGGLGSEWRGKVIAYSDKPSVMIEYEDGSRMVLPAKNVRLANPPKPWHDAKDGGLWLISFTDFPNKVISSLVKDGVFIYNDPCCDGWAPLDSDEIVSARRIWPEDSNDS